MKIKIWSFILLISTVLFIACDPDETGEGNGKVKNYWESNAWVRMQLRGKVKSVTEISDYHGSFNNTSTHFNNQGFITKITSSTDGQTTHETNYYYNKLGQLEKEINESKNSRSADTTFYTYDTHGKYVINSTFHIHETGLTPNLKSIRTIGDYLTEYTFEGDELLIIGTSIYDDELSKDTTIVQYNGKYPVGTTTEWSFVENMQFYPNGMFKQYSEGFYGTDFRDTRTYHFHDDNEFLRKKSATYTSTGDYGSTSSFTYTYNDKKDLTEVKEMSGDIVASIEEYFDYTYDDKNNWTSRKQRTKYDGGEWITGYIETREIVYW
jgi:hypothetical protein